MGMFDDIICEMPLDGNPPCKSWQSKSLECALDKYVIAEDGTLWRVDYVIEDQSDAAKWERDNPGKEVPEGIVQFRGCLARVSVCRRQLNDFHGEILFYDNDDKLDVWWEYSALFVEGKLLSIKRVSPETVPSPSPQSQE